MQIAPKSRGFTVVLGLFAALPALSIDLSAPSLPLLPDALGTSRAIAGLTLQFPILTSLDWIAATIALAATVAILRFKLGALTTLACGALAGLATLLI